MEYNNRADLDTSDVSDLRGSGGGGFGGVPIAFGGGGLGIVALIIYLVVQFASGGGGSGSSSTVLDSLGAGNNANAATNGDLARECRTGADANANLDCAVVADIDSRQEYWA